MPYIPHTEAETRSMLERIGIGEIDQLFDEIPAGLRCRELEQVPQGVSELEISVLMQQRAREDGQPLSFLGAGAYEHHIPAIVWQLATRGEFYSAYTPYQAEASQGTLQLVYEYQSMMCELTAMDVSNASLYDGASALAEAILMAVRCQRRHEHGRVLLPRSLHPAYRRAVATLVGAQGIELLELPFERASGRIDRQALAACAGQQISALVIPQPNFFGVLDEVDELSDWAAQQGAMSIAVVNPLSLAVLKPPGEWGGSGVDICCGEGQPLGIPLSSGGPYFGFLCCRQAHVRQMPGRIVGRTEDLEGKPGFTLTLQAREQHIRRSKATSNICTNQGLMVTAATIHMAVMGAAGLRQAAELSLVNRARVGERFGELGLRPLFSAPCFHEQAFALPLPARDLERSLAGHNILPGFDLSSDYPELGDSLLVCATETKTEADLERLYSRLQRVLAARQQARCPVEPKFDR
jgi:glycine dehydrogenase subunit 1